MMVASAGANTTAQAALRRIRAVLAGDGRPQSRLDMLRRFQALDVDGSGVISGPELIEGEAGSDRFESGTRRLLLKWSPHPERGVPSCAVVAYTRSTSEDPSHEL